MDRTYLCIDLKSFYASVECVTRGLDPLTTNLVVADVGRTEKTICLAVTPSLKSYGIPGRARLFEVIQKVEQINRQRKYNAPHHKLDCESYNAVELERNPSLALSYIAAPPRMAYYMEYSTRIYNIKVTPYTKSYTNILISEFLIILDMSLFVRVYFWKMSVNA